MDKNIHISDNPFEPGQVVYTTNNFAGNKDIIKTIENALPGAVSQTKNIAQQFKGKDIKDTCANVWYWLKNNIDYKKDDDSHQIVKYPSKLLSDGTSDCKSFALFTAGILKNLNIPFVIRYINQDGDSVPKHVYVVAYDENLQPVYIDVVYTSFDAQPPQIKYQKDYNYNTMKVSAIAGITNKTTNDPLRDFINKKMGEVYGIGDLFDTLIDQGTYALTDATTGGGGEILRGANTLAPQTKPSALLKSFNPFGAPAVSNKKDELLVMTSPNSNNLFRKLYTGFRLQNQNGNTISNAYAFDHVIPDTEAGLKQGGLSGDYAKWDFHQYTVNDIYNKVGGDWDGFLAKLKSKYGNNDIIVSNAQYLWEVNAFADLFKTFGGDVDKFLSQFGVSSGSSSSQNQTSPQTNSQSTNNNAQPANSKPITPGATKSFSDYVTPANIGYSLLGLTLVGFAIYKIKN